MSERVSYLLCSCVLTLTFLACGQPSNDTESGKSEMNSNESEYGLTKKKVPHFDVAFYNTENLFDTQDDPRTNDDDFTPAGKKEWTKERYRIKLDHLADVIEAMRDDGRFPAIVGLAEVENEHVLEDLCERLLTRGVDYGIVHKDSKDKRGIDVALLYDRTLFKSKRFSFLPIDFSDRGFTSRDILYFKGQFANGEDIHFYVNHWPSRREGKTETEHRRIEAAKSLMKAVRAVTSGEPEAKIIILGDFNDHPTDRSITDVLSAANRADASKPLNNLAYGLNERGLGTYVYKGDWNMLDQAIVSGSLLKEHGVHIGDEGLEIFGEDFMFYYDRKAKEKRPNRTYGYKYYGGYSDHLPLRLHLDVSK